MKRILLTAFLCIMTLTSTAQIFSRIEYYDKFDDIIKTEKIKTLINIDEDSLFIDIETKGRKNKRYYIFDDLLSIDRNGQRDSVVNLVSDIYGYETSYYCVEEKDTADFNKWWQNDILAKWNNNELTFGKLIETKFNNKYVVRLTHRVVTTEYTMSFRNRYFWIRKNDGSRIVFSE